MSGRLTAPVQIAVNVTLIAAGLALIVGGAAFVIAVCRVLFVSESNVGGPMVIVAIGAGLVVSAFGIMVVGASVTKQRSATARHPRSR